MRGLGRGLGKWTGRLGLLAGSILVSLLLMEGAARLLHERTFDPHWTYGGRKHELDDSLIYRHVPLAAGVQDCSPGKERPNRMCRKTLEAGETYLEAYEFDEHGIRSNSSEIAWPAADPPVILVTGDSYTYGAMVQGHETWAARLEVALAEEGRHARVLNAAVNGYGMDQKYRYVRKRAARHRPRLVLIGLHGNDRTDDIREPLYGLEDDRLVGLDARRSWRHVQGRLYLGAPGWLKSSHLYDLVLSSLNDRDLHGVRPDDEEAQHEFAYRKTFLQLVDLHRSGSELGFRTLTIRVPATYAEERYPDLAGQLRQAGVPYLDLDRSFREELGEDGFLALFFAEGHPNPRGQEAIARATLDYLLEHPELLAGDRG